MSQATMPELQFLLRLGKIPVSFIEDLAGSRIFSNHVNVVDHSLRYANLIDEIVQIHGWNRGRRSELEEQISSEFISASKALGRTGVVTNSLSFSCLLTLILPRTE